ncbi:MAG: glutamate--tRNA ligase [Chloroflexota bacterium]|nr:glutamate--tRNA ligase [Chloroflexota bacterium]MDE2910112.1 glutamate--tRNA ligase [Chloroflexota bacterium]
MTSDSDRPVRTRYAPSPTGPQHIGGIRTALFAWLFARRHGGQFILRIEDTDQKRTIPGSIEMILDAFDWLGMDIDEGPREGGAYGPYVQSERLELYQTWAKWLVENGYAYKCFATAEELAEMRKQVGGYDRRYRDIPTAESDDLEARGLPYVIRFKMPATGVTIGEDIIRGEVEFANDQLQDAVLLKSDGFPTYHLAHIVDDHYMRISHITRAVEWLPSFPLHIQIWNALGWEKPQFAHMPVFLNPNGKGKLSKRNAQFTDADGKSVPVLVHEFIEAGYLPAAVMNFLSNIGWNFGDNEEIFSTAQAIERFDLKDVNPANSAYPIAKLDWLNSQYIQRADVDELSQLLQPILEAAGYTVDEARLQRVVPLLQVRLKSTHDVVPMAGFFFADWSSFEAPPAEILIQRKMDGDGTAEILRGALLVLQALDSFKHDAQYAAMSKFAKAIGYKNGQVFGSLRAAVSGQKVSPPTFETMEILGKDESLRRIKLALQALIGQTD